MPLPTNNVFISVTITLPDSVAHRVYDLMKAIDPNCPGSARELLIQFDPINPPANAYVLFGDSNVSLSPQRAMVNLLPADSFPLREGLMSAIPFQNLFVISSVVGSVINIGLVL